MKIFVGMSGGVDSSVTAKLLEEQGHDVTGVFIKGYYPGWLKYSCPWQEEKDSAEQAAKEIGIPFEVLRAEEAYKKAVVDYMVLEYKAGHTPNPDIMCNKYVKFGVFLDYALSRGAEAVATGHYARTIAASDRTELWAGVDQNKDQSYFLWALNQKQLSKIIFPLGDKKKPEVRKLAEKYNLSTATKKDSQGICFLGEVSIKDFLSEYLPPRRGEVLDESGEVIGYHDGAWFVTIGQRSGFVITKKTPNDKPRFVVDRNIEKNTITVATKDTIEHNHNKKAKGVKLRDVNIINKGKWGGDRQCRFRYRQKLLDCEVKEGQIIFADLQITVAIGQSLVVYDGDECLGGGIIAEILI